MEIFDHAGMVEMGKMVVDHVGEESISKYTKTTNENLQTATYSGGVEGGRIVRYESDDPLNDDGKRPRAEEEGREEGGGGERKWKRIRKDRGVGGDADNDDEEEEKIISDDDDDGEAQSQRMDQ